MRFFPEQSHEFTANLRSLAKAKITKILSKPNLRTWISRGSSREQCVCGGEGYQGQETKLERLRQDQERIREDSMVKTYTARLAWPPRPVDTVRAYTDSRSQGRIE